MRIAYLILAHDNPAQLDRLLARLVPPGSPDVAIVHADARSPLWPDMKRRMPRDSETIRLIRDPVAVRWGHWSQVAAVARLVEAADRAGCDHAHLISGVDWPVASRDVIAAALGAASEPLCHIEAAAHVQENRMQGFRLDAPWLRLDPDRDRLAYAATWQLRRLSRWGDSARTRLGSERSRPWGPWRKGWTWWTLPADALAMLAAELPRLLASGRLAGTVCADEHVIPTLVAANFASRLAPYRRFIIWPQGQSSPRLLRRDDLPAIEASQDWFMRKVLASHDPFFYDLPVPC